MLSRILLTLTVLLSGLGFGLGLTEPAAHAAGFVTRTGTRLTLDGAGFRFSGANMYWLGLAENPSVRFPTDFEVDDAMTAAREMGLTVVRSHTLGDTVGCPQCLEPTLGTFDPSAFQRVDYAVKSAAEHGVHLVIPLVDHGAYYEGGIHDYVAWRGGAADSLFYTDPTIIADFEQHIDALLNHVNTYTGVALKDDPTILAWEEGNELGAGTAGTPPASWAATIADHIKSVDPHHLVAYSASPGLQENTLTVPDIDIEDAHYYPMSVSALQADAAATENAGKVFYAGEYDWANHMGGDPLAGFLSAIEGSGAAGDTFWSLFPHDPGHGYVQHGDGYTLHYPGEDADVRDRAQALRAHAYAMRGLSVPADGVPDAPLITQVSGKAITWRGGALALSYSVERSTSGPTGPWTRICDGCATDDDTPWTDTTQPAGTVWYHVKGYNRAGDSSAWSPAYRYVPGAVTTTDELTDWSTAYAHSANAGFDTSNPAEFGSDASRAARVNGSQAAESVTWRQDGMDRFTATTYFWPGEPVAPFALDTSADGTTWTPATPSLTGGAGDWLPWTYSLSGLTGVNYVRMVWTDTTGQSWSPQIAKVTLSH